MGKERRIDKFLSAITGASDSYKLDVTESCPTRIRHYRIKGLIGGRFYSIEVIDRRFDVPELKVRDFTTCKNVIINYWDEGLD